MEYADGRHEKFLIILTNVLNLLQLQLAADPHNPASQLTLGNGVGSVANELT